MWINEWVYPKIIHMHVHTYIFVACVYCTWFFRRTFLIRVLDFLKEVQLPSILVASWRYLILIWVVRYSHWIRNILLIFENRCKAIILGCLEHWITNLYINVSNRRWKRRVKVGRWSRPSPTRYWNAEFVVLASRLKLTNLSRW